ncbi:uncharacterized protein K460DRAFT_362543 [Cucurbitaria berberidis CBS 394.84]|uniref:Zinc finger PHD-type domain-containing protein n=1 Tax=Cucurbitaria berberidis CBS 394.84 TaxID=1168544 RepID=A0A9P4GS90_9PLEO|nr:uncharacterized protein K460DRAFT_362543 [Cucurbitaria berberidis CBS 394.84]KAF1851793.1 hypothetical protein K460DRAFT_362543 [Cucurbitaria berberidis CBS 394.84]
MVLCENEDCPVQWYHGDCVGIHDELSEEEEWYCPQCVPAQEPGEKAGAKTIGKGQKKRWAN